MVDFRYHIVSLISVFIALSVGVILGAGPLQNAIGDALTSETLTLRDSNAQLMQQNSAAQEELDKHDQAFQALASHVLKNTLTGQSVAIIRAAGVPDDTYSAVTAKLKLAGAQVSTVLGLTDIWTDARHSSYRSAFAQQIAGYVKGVEAGADAETALATALNQLARSGTGEANNATLAEMMSESDTPLLEKSTKLASAATVVLLLTPDASAPQASGDKKTDTEAQAVVDYSRTMLVKIAQTVANKGNLVVAGAANSAEDAVTQLRTQKTKASTVDNPASALGSLNVPVAIANTLSGTRIDAGTGMGATTTVGDIRTAPKAS
ncbi:MAG: copper transporter [Actinomycetaceae bacterium]|nr:copper transporter [Arcanobacterium sp.]MDD7686496.1 copper transporter [Actinomycetaceae bacterium]MDY5272776.1 copper transporter [Arcanobacterium sp.]